MGNEYFVSAYEDLQGVALNASRPASSYPHERLYAHGIAAGVEFPTLGFAVGEYIWFTFQSRHAMALSSVIDNHIHFCTPTDGTASKFKFQLDVIAAPIDGAWAVPTGSPFSEEHTIAANYATLHKLFDIADIPGVNTTVSTLYKCKLTRIAASSAEYAGEVYVDFFDGHYQRDSNGSETASSKT